MARVDELRARYDAELAVLVLEEELVALKAAEDASGLADCKVRLREARRVYRLQREGEAAVSPEVIEATAGVSDVGG